jgi:hypothetical protein
MRGALFGDELYLPNFSPTWVPASTPNHKDVSMHEESSCLVKREFYPINCGGRRDCFALVAAEKLGGIASICSRSSNKSSVTAVWWLHRPCA